MKGVGPILFGMTRSEVSAHLGSPSHEGIPRSWYRQTTIAVDFDELGKVKFIELVNDETIEIHLNGRPVNTLDADTAVDFINNISPYDDALSDEKPFGYIFPGLQLSLWRSDIPYEGQPSDDQTGRFFDSFGIGREGYFA